jgi:hypothetical protein
MEKLSEKLRATLEEFVAQRDHANTFEAPKVYWLKSGAVQAVERCMKLAEAHEAEWEKRVAELTVELCTVRGARDDAYAALENRNARVDELRNRLRATAEALRDISPGPHPGPMNADEYVPLITKRIRDLQSQLAWTPVSDGLPTEPGTYEFLSYALNIHVYTLEPVEARYRWVLAGLDECYESGELELNYQNFRPITLPEPTP